MRRFVRLVPPLVLAAVLTLTLASPAAAHDVSVVARGLDGPRGLDFGPKGTLYVAESGRGGSGPCVPAGGLPSQCYGNTGAVTRIDLKYGTQKRIVTGLPSLATRPEGAEANGPYDISFRGRRRGYLSVGLHAEVGVRDRVGPGGKRFAKLYTLRPNGRIRPLADLGAFEEAENPDGKDVESNPVSVDSSSRRQTVVVDSSANDLLSVTRRGEVSLLATFPEGIAPSPDIPDFPEPLPPPGTPIPYAAVPTSVVKGPDGAYYVGQLTGFPFAEGVANVYRVEPGEEPEPYLTGFTQIIDIAFGPDESLYVLELSRRSILAVPPYEWPGALYRVRPDGTRVELARGKLEAPTGLAVDDDGTAYVSNRSAGPAGIGEVVAIAPED